jgi:hypothetical protein
MVAIGACLTTFSTSCTSLSPGPMGQAVGNHQTHGQAFLTPGGGSKLMADSDGASYIEVWTNQGWRGGDPCQ